MEIFFRTKKDNAYPTPLNPLDIRGLQLDNSSDIIVQFSSRCVPGYYFSLCHFPTGCDHNQYTTYKIVQDQEAENRGYYEQHVKHLLPCNIFKWEISTLPNNVTLYEDYMFTQAEEKLVLNLHDARVTSVFGNIHLSWTLTQPCIDEYQIEICRQENHNECWKDLFERPSFETEEDFDIEIDLSSLSDLPMESCQCYDVIIKPIIDGTLLQSELVLPFTFIDVIQPPEDLSVSSVGETFALLFWEASNCSNSKEVLILLTREDSSVIEYEPRPSNNAIFLDDLEACSSYNIEAFSIEAGERSVESKKVVFETLGDLDKTNIKLSADSILSESFR